MKLGQLLAPLRRVQRFPGLYCPGLIEAAHHLGSLSARQLGFRGSIAPASLKLNPRDGLARMHLGFRGSIAPASLKHQDAGVDHQVTAGFPGLYCPGLIEASRPPTRAPAATGFPGLYCPGLIEAHLYVVFLLPRRIGFRGSIAPASLKRVRLSDPPVRLSDVSGALLPRPH